MQLSTYLAVLLAVVLTWAAVSVYVLVTRALYDFRHHAFHGARRLVQYWIARGSSAEERERTLRRLPRRTVAGIASDAHVDSEIAAAAARVLLEKRWRRLLRRAMRHRNEAEKWARIATLRIFTIAEWAIADALLSDALRDDDTDVVAAAVALLGERDDDVATRMLADALAQSRYQHSRIATHLDGRPATQAQLLPLADHPDDDVRYWVATLLRPTTADAELALAALSGDRSPTVRAAVAKTFAAWGGEAALAAARLLLYDPVWFVRAQAARALRAGGAEVADELVALLRDDHWWVRVAAKEALTALGAAAIPALTTGLRDPDRFARNGSAEVLFELNVLDAWSGDEPRLAQLLVAGEQPVQRAALGRTSGPRQDELRRIIARLPSARTA